MVHKINMENNYFLKNKGLEEAIYKTMIFFDLFSYPLTAYEVWQYLPLKTDYLTCRKYLDSLAEEQKISEKESFYYLKNQEKNLDLRNKRYHYSNRKIDIAKRMVKLFSFIPWLKFVALSNLIGRHNMRDGSDIDLFIITSKNRLWLTRFFCAGFMKILNKRPNKKTKRDKICLSFYVDEEHLNLKDLALKEGGDYYFYYWLTGLYSLYDKEGYYFYLMKNNNWLKNYLPNIDLFLSNQSYTPNFNFKKRKNIVSKFNQKVFSYLEKISSNFQKRIMPKVLKEKANLDSQVIISQGILKLYLLDRRKEFKQRHLNNFKNFSKNLNKND